ncbi:MAG: 3-hydroxyacyl-CoA dehydrogenase family protein, partial [Alphaproteobacteria bacterium]|nr:3-hydroxyacyl-CoA dehydrogenase family protein [Alphaproteobacteria bacterium]
MKFKINKVAVIGSGVMGGQIAAYITNAGIPVVLLDIVLSDKEDRNYLARTAIEKLLQQGDESSPFMQKKNAELVTIGNLEDDLDKIADADWIIEAVIENPKIKEDLYKKIDAIRKKGSIISSNTSTIPLKNLAKGQSAEFEKDLVITHFFNPLRYMKLLELVSTEKTDPESLNKVAEFCDVALGNGVVCCKDSPGFIANRLGIFFLQCGVDNAFAMGLSVEEADAVLSTPVGMPKSGVFGLMDIIGLDLIPLIAQSFFTTLPQDDVYRTIKMDYPLIEKMIKDGYIGRKGKGGFYRMIKTDAGK